MSEPFTERLLKIVAEHHLHDSIYWNRYLQFFVKCNDFFAWASADCVPVDAEDVDKLEQAIKDAGEDGPLLYCARKAKMRPQGAYYHYLNKDNWHHFDACGPERDVGVGNPKAHP